MLEDTLKANLTEYIFNPIVVIQDLRKVRGFVPLRAFVVRIATNRDRARTAVILNILEILFARVLDISPVCIELAAPGEDGNTANWYLIWAFAFKVGLFGTFTFGP